MSEDWIDTEEKESPVRQSLTGGMKFRMKGKRGVITVPRSIFRAEIKRMYNAAFWDNETFDAPSNTASSYNFFTQITVGGGAANRVGDVIRVHKLVIRLICLPNSNITLQTNSVAVIRDKEPGAGTYAWTDAYNGIGAANVLAYHVAIPNFDKRFRFDYLATKRICTGLSTIVYNGAATVGSVKCIAFEIVLNVNKQIRYDNTTARPYQGCEYTIWGWSEDVANTPQWTASYEVFFSDA